MSLSTNLQKQFFERLKAVSGEEQLSNNVAKVLQLSTSEAYKKISGKSLLNIEQIQLLCDKFRISFEYSPVQANDKVLFSYSKINSIENSIELYLENLHKNLLYIKSFPNGTITSTSDDIPVFNSFKYTELAAFKLYFWQNRTNKKNKNIITGQPFSSSTVSKELTDKCLQLYDIYCSIPGTEVWTKGSILNSLFQIEYAIEARLIKDKEMMATLCNQLKMTIANVSDFAVNEEKTNCAGDKVKFSWYFCENIGSTTYLINVNNNLMCYQRFNTFNSLQTDDAGYCNEVNLWIKSLIKESICVSGQGEKQRNLYIEETTKSIDELMRRIV